MFGRIGPMELILILAIALVIFGPKKLPEIGKAIGEAIKAFRKGSDKISEEVDKVTRPDDEKPSSKREISSTADPQDKPKA